MTLVRSFIGIPSSELLRARLVELQRMLRASDADVKWENDAKLHLTIKFLGNVERGTLEELANSIAGALQSKSSFETTFSTVGAFPSVFDPRVVWAGAPLSTELGELSETVESISDQYGIRRELREFHPHITLGRVKGRRNLVRLTEALKNSILVPTPMRCVEVGVYKSELQRDGSVYSIIRTIPLIT